MLNGSEIFSGEKKEESDKAYKPKEWKHKGTTFFKLVPLYWIMDNILWKVL